MFCWLKVISLSFHWCYIDAMLMIYFKMAEEQPIGTPIGNLTTFLNQTNTSQIQFRLISSQYTKYVRINSFDQLEIKEIVDLESICPPNLNFYEEHASPYHSWSPKTSIKPCEISFIVNILRFSHPLNLDIVDLMRVTIEIVDIDDNVCQFVPSDEQIIYLEENANVSSGLALQLNQLIDLDRDAQNSIDPRSIYFVGLEPNEATLVNSMFDLKIVNQTTVTWSPFKLNFIVKQPLDYETYDKIILQVFASSYLSKSTDSVRYKKCSLTLSIFVTDVNDHVPQFDKKLVEVAIEENITSDAIIYTPKAHDLDRGPIHNQMIFEFAHMNNSQRVMSLFRIDSSNGSVRIGQPIRYSDGDKYSIVMMVRNPKPNEWRTSFRLDDSSYIFDDKLPLKFDTMQLTVTIVDVNDNKPQISVYAPMGSSQVTIVEHTTALPSDFGLVSVTDDDSALNGQTHCQLDANLTDIFRMSPMEYDLETKHISSPNLGMYKLSALVAFDKEITSQVPLQIECTDMGMPRLTSTYAAVVHIQDINDHAPVFARPHEQLELVEDSHPDRKSNHFFILSLNATDKDFGKNAQLVYQLESSELDQYFVINNRTQSLQSLGTLDRELNDTFEFNIRAVDLGSPAQTGRVKISLTILDYNDEYPQFEKRVYQFVIVEHCSIQMIGSLYAIDKDIGSNADLHFELNEFVKRKVDNQNNSSRIPFRIASNYLHNTKMYRVDLFVNDQIDRESLINYNNNEDDDNDKDNILLANQTTDYYQLILKAKDSGVPQRTSEVLIQIRIVDLNDETPKFISPSSSGHIISLSRYKKPNYTIFQFKATDLDEKQNGTVEYQLVSIDLFTKFLSNPLHHSNWCSYHSNDFIQADNLQVYFNLNRSTGALSLSKRWNLFPTQSHVLLRLQVQATDLGYRPRHNQTSLCLVVDQEQSTFVTTTDRSDPNRASTSQPAHLIWSVYVLAAIICLGLVLSGTFLCIAWFVWRTQADDDREGVSKPFIANWPIGWCCGRSKRRTNLMNTWTIHNCTNSAVDDASKLACGKTNKLNLTSDCVQQGDAIQNYEPTLSTSSSSRVYWPKKDTYAGLQQSGGFKNEIIDLKTNYALDHMSPYFVGMYGANVESRPYKLDNYYNYQSNDNQNNLNRNSLFEPDWHLHPDWSMLKINTAIGPNKRINQV